MKHSSNSETELTSIHGRSIIVYDATINIIVY